MLQISNLLRILSKNRRSRRWTSNSAAYAGDGKTTVEILNTSDNNLNLVNTYSANGFRLNNNLFVSGSMILFPTHVFSWNVKRSVDITMDSLVVFDLIVPKIKILVIGFGKQNDPYDSKIPMALKQRGISCEMLPTKYAVTTYNYLVNDALHVAGAFVPTKEEFVTTEVDEGDLLAYEKLFGEGETSQDQRQEPIHKHIEKLDKYRSKPKKSPR